MAKMFDFAEDPPESENGSRANEDIINTFKDCFSESQAYWTPIYNRSKERRRFTLLGKQMNDSEARRYGIKYPMMPNLLLAYVNHEANSTLETNYLGKVSPNGSGATELNARAREYVLRGLQRVNNSAQVYNFARRDQVATGISYSMVRVEFKSSRGFAKNIKDEYLKDTYKVWPSPDVNTSTFSDSRYWVIEEEVSKHQWKEETGLDPSGFAGKKKKKIFHFFIKEMAHDVEYLREDGSGTILESQLGTTKVVDDYGVETEEKDFTGVAMDGDAPYSRSVDDSKWMWYKITEDYDLVDSEEWQGVHSPIVACTGRRVVEDGEVYYQSLTQFAEEPQLIYTLLENIICLRLGRSPYSRWKIPFESVDIKEAKKLREDSMTGDLDLLYKSISDKGVPIPPPEEIQPYVLDPILVELQREQDVKIQKILGIFEASLGEKSNEKSGVAIENRTRNASQTNYDFTFNFLEYVEQLTRVKLDLIPKHFTAPQQVAFVDRDDQQTVQWINTTGGVSFSPDEEYSLSIEVQPVSETVRKDEAEFLAKAANLTPLISNNPQAMALVVGAQPGKSAAALADILKGVNPQLQQAQAQISELQGQLKSLNDAARSRIMEDSVKKEVLKGTITILRQQLQLLRVERQVDKSVNTTGGASPLDAIDTQLKALEIQIDKQEADTNRLQAENERVRVLSDSAAREEAVITGPDPMSMYNIRKDF